MCICDKHVRATKRGVANITYQLVLRSLVLFLCLGEGLLVLVLIRLLGTNVLLGSSRIGGSHLGGGGSCKFSHIKVNWSRKSNRGNATDGREWRGEDQWRAMELVRS